MKKLLLAGVVALAALLTVQAEDAMDKKDAMMKKAAFPAEGLGMQVVNFTDEKAALELAKKSNVVYFFAASWCPSCQGAYKDLKMNFAKLPKDITVVIVDYDSAGELKKKYAVTMQHTFVQIDMKGAKVKAWSGGGVAEILKNTETGAMMMKPKA